VLRVRPRIDDDCAIRASLDAEACLARCIGGEIAVPRVGKRADDLLFLRFLGHIGALLLGQRA
jgi:hypothetical protein